MPSYRFCRPDDVPYLVRAVNECFDVHFPTSPPLTVERFRQEMKEIDVWPSNSMVASSESGPIAVLIGTKRPDAVRVLRLGVRPGHERQGHGRHLLTSLGQKLSVLGPDRLIAEVPRSLAGVADFFAAVGYRREATYTDYLRPAAPAPPVPAEWVVPVTFDEVADAELLAPATEVAWERSVETLKACREQLRGVAVASPERLEAYALCRPADAGAAVDVVALGAADPARREVFLGVLLRHLANDVPLRLPRLGAEEAPATLLADLGFVAGERYDRWTATATPV